MINFSKAADDHGQPLQVNPGALCVSAWLLVYELVENGHLCHALGTLFSSLVTPGFRGGKSLQRGGLVLLKRCRCSQ